MAERYVFEVSNNGKVVCDFTDSMAKSSELKEIVCDESKIQERLVSEEFYQEVVDEGGILKYNI